MSSRREFIALLGDAAPVFLDGMIVAPPISRLARYFLFFV
jgi:hypothetical protein